MLEHPGTMTLPRSSGQVRRDARWFCVGVALMMILLNIVAFAPALIDPSRRNAPLPLTPLLLLHAIVSGCWLLLFVAQTTLVATSRVATHRRVGVIGGVLSIVVVVLSVLVVIAQAKRGFDLSGDIGRLPLPTGVDVPSANVALLYFPLQFAILVGAALWYRRRPAIHRRLMLFAVLGGLTPTPVAHIMGHWIGPQPWADFLFPLSVLSFASLVAVHDWIIEGRVHAMTLWIGFALIVMERVLTLVVQRTETWRSFATWLVQQR
jgi:hypothetical protein